MNEVLTRMIVIGQATACWGAREDTVPYAMRQLKTSDLGRRYPLKGTCVLYSYI